MSKVVPFGVIQSPFFNESNPNYLNLAGLGYLITFEIIYGLREYWWSDGHFDSLDTKCFATDYGKLSQWQVNQNQWLRYSNNDN